MGLFLLFAYYLVIENCLLLVLVGIDCFCSLVGLVLWGLICLGFICVVCCFLFVSDLMLIGWFLFSFIGL